MLDTDAESQTAALMTGTLPATSTELVTLEHKAYGQIRFLELPHHANISDEALSDVLRTADIVLVTTDSTTASEDLERRVSRLNGCIPRVQLSSSHFDQTRRDFIARRYSKDDSRQRFVALVEPLSSHLDRRRARLAL